jgi:hypothetical protein
LAAENAFIWKLLPHPARTRERRIGSPSTGGGEYSRLGGPVVIDQKNPRKISFAAWKKTADTFSRYGLNIQL